MLALGQENDSPQDHVDGRRHEGRRDEDQDVLHDERTHGPAPGIFPGV